MTISPSGYVMPHDYTGYYTVDQLALRRQQERNNEREYELNEIKRLQEKIQNS